jgi:7-keto-8-aminopelargonate synthetase-like enzyme
VKRSGVALVPLSTDLVEKSIGGAAREGAMMLLAGPGEYDGRRVDVDGEPRFNFGSCSYLGLELRHELTQGVIDAVRRYGTQFPFAQPFLKCPLYGELESLLGQMTDGHVLVAPSTTLAHIAAMPVLVGPSDAVIVDQFAHASVYTGARLIRGAHTEILPHNRLDLLVERVTQLSKKHDAVWYALDGLYSMRGDLAPLGELSELLAQFPALRLYIDDAHCTSWMGKHGRGYTLDRMVDRDRLVVALSLNKAFSAAGGALVFPSAALKDRVRLAGGPMLFSGAVQPPMLGAAVASARLHLSEEFADLQKRLIARIERVHDLAEELDIPLASEDLTPIAFIPCGPHEVTFALCHAMRRRGYYIAPAVFPGVPYNKSGLRLTVSLHNDDREVAEVMSVLAEEIRRFPEMRDARGKSGVLEVASLPNGASPGSLLDAKGTKKKD